MISHSALVEEMLASRKGNESVFDTFERIALDYALHRTQGSQVDAAAVLGVSKRTINYKLQKYAARPVDVERSLWTTPKEETPHAR